jgi:DNA-binding response OmpR family regulator
MPWREEGKPPMPMEPRVVLAVAAAEEREALAGRLAASGFAVRQAAAPPCLAACLAEAQAQALVLDGRFTGTGTGAAAQCAALRREGLEAPILVLHDDVVDCLEAGANDAVRRPVRGLELAARLRALLRHHAAALRPVEIGPYLFRPAERTLHAGPSGRAIRLTATEAAMLRYLHRAGGSCVPRQELLREVWGYRAGVTTHTVETHIYRLRRKIEPEPGRRRLLLSEDAGYRLNLAGAAAQDLARLELRDSA